MNSNENNRSKTIESIMFVYLLIVATACSWVVAIYNGILLVHGAYTINTVVDVLGLIMTVIEPFAFTIWTFREADSI